MYENIEKNTPSNNKTDSKKCKAHPYSMLFSHQEQIRGGEKQEIIGGKYHEIWHQRPKNSCSALLSPSSATFCGSASNKIHLRLISEATNMGWQGCTASSFHFTQNCVTAPHRKCCTQVIASFLFALASSSSCSVCIFYQDYHRIVLMDQALSCLWIMSE